MNAPNYKLVAGGLDLEETFVATVDVADVERTMPTAKLDVVAGQTRTVADHFRWFLRSFLQNENRHS